jgi:hypothetical protein
MHKFPDISPKVNTFTQEKHVNKPENINYSNENTNTVLTASLSNLWIWKFSETQFYSTENWC